MNHELRRALSGTRVLIVEDEYYLADDLSRALAQVGAQVVGPVGTLSEAAEKVGEGGFDFAVVDINLRGELAYAIADQLRSESVPFVVATGYEQTSLPDYLLNVPRVEKPFTSRDVIQLLTEMRRTPSFSS